MSVVQTAEVLEIPKTGLAGLKENWKADLGAGFSISLIALPLCLGIAVASHFPPIAGLITAIIGGLLVSRIRGSHVTINGPAAGLIVVNLAAVERLGQGDTMAGFHYALAAIAIAGVLIMFLGFMGAGKYSYFFPSSVIHGMLASIGVIIASKQIHVLVGVKPESTGIIPGILEIPASFLSMHPDIALIGLGSLLIMVLHPLIKVPAISALPGPMWVVLFAIPMAKMFNLEDQYLIHLPDHPLDGLTVPNFSKILTMAFWISVGSIALVTAIESLLSTTAIDKLDPYKRKSDLNKDLRGVGIGSTLAGLIGGLPLIAEIVRSKANILNGARTSWANFFHGGFLLIYLVVLAPVIQMIPYSSLAGILVFIGYKLAAPEVFRHIYQIGKDQILVFVTTLVTVLAVDLLVGVFAGIVLKLIMNVVFFGVPLKSLFTASVQVDHPADDHVELQIRHAAIFANFLSLKKHLHSLPRGQHVTLNFSEARVVDHSMLSHLQDYAVDYQKEGGTFVLTGLDTHTALSASPLATRYLSKSKTTHMLRSTEIKP